MGLLPVRSALQGAEADLPCQCYAWWYARWCMMVASWCQSESLCCLLLSRWHAVQVQLLRVVAVLSPVSRYAITCSSKSDSVSIVRQHKSSRSQQRRAHIPLPSCLEQVLLVLARLQCLSARLGSSPSRSHAGPTCTEKCTSSEGTQPKGMLNAARHAVSIEPSCGQTQCGLPQTCLPAGEKTGQASRCHSHTFWQWELCTHK